jgi:two-component system KDP operon response regulator KdpE
MKILLVEDAPQVVESLTLTFQLQWADVEIVSTDHGETAINLVESERPDLVLLDIGLPDIDGYKVLQAIREFSDLPVIMLTARDETMDKVKGLELGADDYITKPFDHLELLARMRSVLRRLDLPAPRSRIPSVRSAELEVDFQSQEARLGGTRLDLTPTEYKLLYHLVRNPGRVLTHETLLSRVWGREYTSELDYLRVYIRRLRDRLNDDPLRPVYIRTERGIGYRFLAPPPKDTRSSGVEEKPRTP